MLGPLDLGCSSSLHGAGSGSLLGPGPSGGDHSSAGSVLRSAAFGEKGKEAETPSAFPSAPGFPLGSGGLWSCLQVLKAAAGPECPPWGWGRLCGPSRREGAGGGPGGEDRFVSGSGHRATSWLSDSASSSFGARAESPRIPRSVGSGCLKGPRTEITPVVRGFCWNQLDEEMQRVRIPRGLLRLRGSPGVSAGAAMGVGRCGLAEQASRAGSGGSRVIPLF